MTWQDDAIALVPNWLKGIFFAFLSVLQLGAGLAYAEAPAVEKTEGFRIDAITAVALASPVVTLAIGAMTIVSRHRITERQMDYERIHDQSEQDIEARQKAVEVRLTLLEKGIPCEHADCPIVEIATGKRDWSKLPPLKPNPATAKPNEDTVDIP